MCVGVMLRQKHLNQIAPLVPTMHLELAGMSEWLSACLHLSMLQCNTQLLYCDSSAVSMTTTGADNGYVSGFDSQMERFGTNVDHTSITSSHLELFQSHFRELKHPVVII